MRIEYPTNDRPSDPNDYQPDRPDVLTWLQAWYTANCNGDGEHAYGIQVKTLDNPGWSVAIKLSGTELADRLYERYEVHRSEDDWLMSWVEADTWQLACGPLNLGEGLHRFRIWAG